MEKTRITENFETVESYTLINKKALLEIIDALLNMKKIKEDRNIKLV